MLIVLGPSCLLKCFPRITNQKYQVIVFVVLKVFKLMYYHALLLWFVTSLDHSIEC